MNSVLPVGPDENAAGFLGEPVRSLRYDYADDHPQEVAALIAGFVPHGARVLDVGCGTGCVSAVVQRLRDARLIGVEPDAERVLAARERGIEVVEGYLTRALIEELGTFDVVVFADVLEHLSNPSELLQLGCSALARDGVVVISVPNVAHWSVRWGLLRGRFEYEQYGIMDATHLRWFTADSLAAWLHNNGLAVERMTQSAGAKLPVYSRAWPWRAMSQYRRFKLIRLLALRWPLLFGCQHIVLASRANGGKPSLID
jgi:methionine biosynthesis protein MetW